MSHATPLAAVWWPLSGLNDALDRLTDRHGIAAAAAPPGHAEAPPPSADALDPWLEWAAARIGIEALPVETTVAELPRFLLAGGPALVRLPRGGEEGFLVLDGARRGQPVLLTPAGQAIALAATTLTAWLIRDQTAPLQPDIDRLLDAAAVPAARRARVSGALIAERIGGEPVRGLTLLRLPARADLRRQLRAGGLPGRLAQIVAIFMLLYAADLAGWRLIGGATIAGRLDLGWLMAWVLLAFTMLPGRLLAGWAEALFSLDAARLLKARLLAGALALPPDAVRRRGVGALIGQVMESQALEGLALGGAFGVLVGGIELGFAGWVLQRGAEPLLHGLLLALFVGLVVLFALGFDRRISGWTTLRLGLTDHMIEAMIGHRTRLAQERAQRRDAAEDAMQSGYLAAAVRMDRATLRGGTGLAAGWLLLGLAGLAPALARPDPPAAAALAISLGGIMLAQHALGGIGGGLASLSRARFAWRQVADLVRAGAREEPAGTPVLPDSAPGPTGGPLLEAHGLQVRHEGARDAVLRDVDLAIDRGDRILIEGPSGGGKSTLAQVLTGLRPAQRGLLLLAGLDRPTLGEGWHARITAAPQFHDNHILSGTLAFNLLMGRQWPPREADLSEAREVCEELGLGELLERMPGGLHQRVGETGWQLSHGERSRIFLARALLQRAAVTILDESFASLDPATIDRCLDTALRRAETLVVIAHP